MSLVAEEHNCIFWNELQESLTTSKVICKPRESSSCAIIISIISNPNCGYWCFPTASTVSDVLSVLDGPKCGVSRSGLVSIYVSINYLKLRRRSETAACRQKLGWFTYSHQRPSEGPLLSDCLLCLKRYRVTPASNNPHPKLNITNQG